MASSTAQTEYHRHLRRKNAGKADRRVRNNKGTTPSFPIHTPDADAAVPAEAKPVKG
jgi:hypothetical protein